MLQLFEVPVFECFLCDDAAVMGQFFQRTADDLQVQGQLLQGFHQFHAEHGIIIYFAAALQAAEKGISHFPVVANKELADAFKTLCGSYINEDIIGSGFHTIISINDNAICTGYKLLNRRQDFMARVNS